MSDGLRSFIRTVLPGAWSVLVLWLVSLGLPQTWADWLASDQVVTQVVQIVSLAAVYAVTRWVEPLLPDWLTRVLLGSATPPTYTEPIHIKEA
jgi:hypothetical protein